MSVEITMPQLGETVTEGTITRWAKKVGDEVAEDEILFEVSTDKVDSEVPSPAAGVISEILVQEGETVDVGVRLAVITPNGEAAAEPAPGAQPEPEPEPEPEPNAEQPSATPQVDGEEQAPVEDGAAPPAPAPPAPAPPAPAPPSQAADGNGAASKLLSPIVRRLVSEHGLDPGQIQGTGSGGRITRADVLAVIEARGDARAPAATPAPLAKAPAAASAPSSQPARARADEVVAFSNIRRRTAEHMRRSLDTSAHTLVVVEVDYHNVEAVRLPARERFKATEGIGLSYLPFVGRAVIDALREFPFVNASVGDNELIVHHEINLGIAVDLSHEGLIVPVVHGADDKRLAALARAIAELASRARSKKLSADDISGGTFTITNPGGYGTFLTGPIINQPQVAILSTDGVKPKPVAVAVAGGGHAVAVHPVGNLALAFDHRAFDGAYASAFLARVRDTLETRDWSLELA